MEVRATHFALAIGLLALLGLAVEIEVMHQSAYQRSGYTQPQSATALREAALKHGADLHDLILGHLLVRAHA